MPLHPLTQLRPFFCISFAFVLFMFMCFHKFREQAHCPCIRSLSCTVEYENKESEHTVYGPGPSIVFILLYILCICSRCFHVLLAVQRESGHTTSASTLLSVRKTMKITRTNTLLRHPLPQLRRIVCISFAVVFFISMCFF